MKSVSSAKVLAFVPSASRRAAATKPDFDARIQTTAQVIDLNPYVGYHDSAVEHLVGELFVLVGYISDLRMAWRGGQIDFFCAQLNQTEQFAADHGLSKTVRVLREIAEGVHKTSRSYVETRLDIVEALAECTIDATLNATEFA